MKCSYIEERAYRKWCLNNHLFLNPLNEVMDSSTAFAHEPLTIIQFTEWVKEIDSIEDNKPPKYFAMLNQLKEEYIYARFLYYEGEQKSKTIHFADKNVKLSDGMEYLNYSIRVEQLKSSYKILFSIYDKTAFFINDLWKLGFKEKMASADRVFKSKNYPRDNVSLTAMKWVYMEFCEKFGNAFVVKGYPYNNGEIHNVVFLHLPSKREDAGGRRTAVLRKVREAVISCDKNVIIGDFNMNPYEKIMTSVIEMNAVSSVQIAKRQKRKFVEDEYRFYYNPMWNFLGDKNIPQGTHYYSTSEEESVYWNIFDQIIVSSALVDDVDIENIKIIDMLDKVSLNKNGKPDPSVHFPIYCELKGER